MRLLRVEMFGTQCPGRRALAGDDPLVFAAQPVEESVLLLLLRPGRLIVVEPVMGVVDGACEEVVGGRDGRGDVVH